MHPRNCIHTKYKYLDRRANGNASATYFKCNVLIKVGPRDAFCIDRDVQHLLSSHQYVCCGAFERDGFRNHLSCTFIAVNG